MGLTAYAQEEKAKREAWREMSELRKHIAELEKEKAIGVYHFTVEEYKAHNLEQQAKGLTDYAKEQEQGLNAVWMIAAASKLINQAKALKEQGE